MANKKHVKISLTATIVAFAFYGVLFYPQAAAQGAQTGLTFCSEILIPSLFPFLVLSSFVVRSGLSHQIGALLSPLTKALFNLPGCTGATILIGLIGGYPTGARGIKALYEQKDISQSQAEQMICFTVGAGPAFVISIVGSCFFRNTQIGIILFISCLSASILLGIILGLLNRNKGASFNDAAKLKPKPCNASGALVESCADSTYGMLNMCAFVVLFSSVLAICNQTQITNLFSSFLIKFGVSPGFTSAILPIFLEVTVGCSRAIAGGVNFSLVAFALGWAGICVHFQIFDALNNIKFSKLKFVFFRLIHGLLSAGISYIIFLFYPITIEVFQTSAKSFPLGAYSFTSGSLALILLCACFLATLTPKMINHEISQQMCE